MAMMKAVRIHGYGGPEVLVYEDAPRPDCSEDDVLIEVRAAGVNPVDWKIREGHFREMLPRSLPFIPGWDVAGTIVEKGSRVKGLRLHDRVYALASFARDGYRHADEIRKKVLVVLMWDFSGIGGTLREIYGAKNALFSF